MQYFIILVIAFFLFAFFNYISRSTFRFELEKIRKEFNLHLDKGSFFINPGLYGNIDGKKIKITKETGNKKNYWNIEIYHDIGINGEFNITKESIFSKLRGGFSFGDIKTYYKDFDDKMLLSANPSINLTAILNKKVMDYILSIYEYTSHLEITEYCINIKINADMFCSQVPQAAYIIRTANSISNNLCNKKSIKQRLIENVNNMTDDTARMNNFNYLIENYGQDKDVHAILYTLLKDKDLNIQAAAAKELGEDGLEHLYKILKKQSKNKNIFNPDIIIFFGQKKFMKSIPLILDIYKNTDIASLKSVILLSLKDFADSSVSDFLVNELKNKDQKLRDEAVNALSSCGKREAVEPLHKLGKSIFNPAVKNLIHEAISKIQSRLGSVDMGALSVAEHSERDGALSISEETVEGGLSLTDEGKKDKGLSQEGGV